MTLRSYIFISLEQITFKLGNFPNLTYSLLEILPKTRFEACRVVFWSLLCYKELKLTTNPFTGRTLHGLLFQMQNISLRSLDMHRKQNFEIVLEFKSDTAVLAFTFRFLSFPLFFTFLASFFFSCWAFSRLHFGAKSFRILGLGERKGRWAMEQDFHGDLQVNLTWFFCLFLWCP